MIPDDALDDEATIEGIAERFLEDLQAGRRPDRSAICRAHPGLGEALDRRIALLEVLHQAVEEERRRASVSLETVDPGAGAEEGAPGFGRTGRFQVLGLLGRGTFGDVYRVIDKELGRTVAIKVPRSDRLGTGEERERFLREARSAALLKHEGIVQVYEINHDPGVPYIVSEYIEGRTLADAIQGERPGFRESAELAARIADALDHAHGEGVIHRDIKPGNILLDSSGRPHVADFGLARREGGEATVTVAGQILGTPAYMSPEQAAGDCDLVDARSDLYSLGVILYELLTGERPFRGQGSKLTHQVLHDEPRPLRALDDRIPRDLETICLKAMAKERHRRYPAARDLAGDLRRFLGGMPIHARAVRAPERAWRWMRRNPALAGLTVAVAGLLLAIALVSSILALRTARARDEANRRLSLLDVQTGTRLVAEGDYFSALPWLAEALRIDAGDGAREEMHRMRVEALLDRSPRLSQMWFPEEEIREVIFSPDGKRIAVNAGRAWLASSLEGDAAFLPFEHGGAVEHIVFSPDGARVVTCGYDGAARVWSAATREPVLAPIRHSAAVNGCAFSGDGRRLATASADGTARVWDPSSGEPIGPPLLHAGPVLTVSFSPDGRLLVTGCSSGISVVWDWASGEKGLPDLVEGESVQEAAFSPDGRRIVTASGGTASLWDAATGKKTVTVRHRSPIHRVSFSPDGSRVLTASQDATAVVWDAESGRAVLPPLKHVLGVPYAEFSRDGRRIVTASFDATVRVWDSSTGKPVLPPLLHENALVQASFSPDGRFLVTASCDRVVRLWDLSGGEMPIPPLWHARPVREAAFSPEGDRVVTACANGLVHLWDAASGREVLPPLLSPGGALRASFSPDGGRLLIVGGDGAARLRDARSGQSLQVIRLDHPIRDASFSPDGRLVALAGQGGEARICLADAGKLLVGPLKHRGAINQASFSPDGSRLVTASEDGTARVWDAATGKAITGPLTHSRRQINEVVCASFSPDGKRVVTASADETAGVWDAATGKRLSSLRHTAELSFATFSPEGSRVATASLDGTARVWEADTGRPVTPQLQHGDLVLHVSFSPDGRLVATASEDGTARIWDAATGEQVAPPLQHAGPVRRAAFCSEARRGASLAGGALLRVVTASEDGTARIWDLSLPQRPDRDLPLLTLLLSGRRLDAMGGLQRLDAAELRGMWETLRPKYPATFTCSVERLAAGHLREAVDCERSRLWAAALSHLEAVAALRPADRLLHARRGEVHAELGQWRESAADFEEALELGSPEVWRAYEAALLRFRMGDLEAYRKDARAALERSGGRDASPNDLNNASWACLLGPGGAEETEMALELSRRTVLLDPRKGDFRNTLGAALYRTGSFAEAAEQLRQAIELHGNGGSAWDWLFLAMTEERLGRPSEARAWLDRASSWFQRATAGGPAPAGASLRWQDRLELSLLVEEARTVAGAIAESRLDRFLRKLLSQVSAIPLALRQHPPSE